MHDEQPSHIGQYNNRQCHYKVLKVPQHATAEEVKKSYHKLARKNHPDKINLSRDSDVFLRIKSAWEVLGDERRRKAYDDSIKRLAHRETSVGNLALQMKLSEMEECELEDTSDDDEVINTSCLHSSNSKKIKLAFTADCPCGDIFILSDNDVKASSNNTATDAYHHQHINIGVLSSSSRSKCVCLYVDCLSCSHKLCVLVDRYRNDR